MIISRWSALKRNHRNVFPFNLELINTLVISSCKLYVLRSNSICFSHVWNESSGTWNLSRNPPMLLTSMLVHEFHPLSTASLAPRFANSVSNKAFSRRNKSSPRYTWSGISSTKRWSHPASSFRQNSPNPCHFLLFSSSLYLNIRIFDPRQSNVHFLTLSFIDLNSFFNCTTVRLFRQQLYKQQKRSAPVPPPLQVMIRTLWSQFA